MKKTIFILMFLAVSLGFTGWVEASMVIPAADRAKENSQAPEHSPAIGENWDIERVDFVHYVKPENPGKPGKTDTCYKLMGVKWNTMPVKYYFNPADNDTDATSTVFKIMQAAETWDAATGKELFYNYPYIDQSAPYGVYDGKNTITFGPYDGVSNVIAVTSIWYSKAAKEIVEFDMLFNDYYQWGDSSINPAVMDIANIATHELGHSVGLSDLYTTGCSAVTMYGYSTEGETSKRTLEQADITGLRKMYGI